MRSVRFVLLLMVAVLGSATGAAAQQVWTGLTKSFSKPTGTDNHLLPEYQDHITSNVALTRGDTAGMFNIAIEGGYSMGTSPEGTRWATSLLPGNESQTISASNYANLTFNTWMNAFGGQGQLATAILELDAVVHLIEDDIYLDLRFTDWAIRAGGFSYLRSVAIPEPASWVLALVGMLACGVRRR